jgi:hypothetical protein
MPAYAFVIPVLPGKEQADLDWMEEMTGPRREEYESSWKRLGVTRHAVWHQQTPERHGRGCVHGSRRHPAGHGRDHVVR